MNYPPEITLRNPVTTPALPIPSALDLQRRTLHETLSVVNSLIGRLGIVASPKQPSPVKDKQSSVVDSAVIADIINENTKELEFIRCELDDLLNRLHF